MKSQASDHSLSGSFQVELSEHTLIWQKEGRIIKLSEKWAIFYTLLALKQGELLSVDELCEYSPWANLQRESVGRMLWKFINQQENEVFGMSIAKSPPRQSTKFFFLNKEVEKSISFFPDVLTIQEALAKLKRSRTSLAIKLSNISLMLQTGDLDVALEKLEDIKSEATDKGDVAHIEVLKAIGLEKKLGISHILHHISRLKDFLQYPDLSQNIRVKILIRLARFFTLTEDYPQARIYFSEIKSLIKPKSDIDLCYYYLNFGLFLRRQDDIKEAIRYTKLAHDVSHEIQWWYGVQASQSNLSLMYITLAEKAISLQERTLYYSKALEWSLACHQISQRTRQGRDEVIDALQIGTIYAELGDAEKSRDWLQSALEHAKLVKNLTDQIDAYKALYKLELSQGNEILANEYLLSANSPKT